MTKFPKAFLAIFAVGALSLGCGLTDLAEDIFSRIPNPEPLELWVATSGNDANDCVSVGTPCLTLRAAYDKSTTNSTIHIGAGEFIEERGINLNNGITLAGAGRDLTIIRAVSGDYVLEVGGWRDVAIRDLSIIGRDGGDVDVGFVDVGPYDDGPIGINVSGGASGGVLIENCRVTQNITGIRIQYPASTVTINNCVIEDNHNGVLNSGGLSMRNTTLQHNAAGPGRYRARWATMVLGNASDAVASLTDNTFDNNGVDGEFSFTIENKGNMSLFGGTIIHNRGEFRNEGGYLYLEHVEIIENYNSGVTFMGSRIAHIDSRLTINSSIIKDSGGAGVAMYGEFGDHGDVKISQTAIIGNDKGGLMVHSGEFTLSVENTTISGNLPGIRGLGAGIHLSRGNLFLLHSTVAFNEGVGVSEGDSAYLSMGGALVALNAGEECIIRGDYSSSSWACEEEYTQAELGLGSLAEEAGTWVHPLLPGSPLIDAFGAFGDCRPNDIDQRGFARPAGSGCDFGAYEYEGGSVIAPLEFVTPTDEGTPVVVPLYTKTPAPKTPITLTFTKNAYCRKGPGVLYRDVSSFNQGETAQVDGRNDADPRWWWVQMPDSQEHCWVSHMTVQTNDLAEDLPIQTVSLELPEAPADFVISNRACTAKSYALRLAWTKSPDADGYILYRNGEEIATFKTNQTTFEDSPAMNEYHLYELAAFNADGYSERLGVEDNCP